MDAGCGSSAQAHWVQVDTAWPIWRRPGIEAAVQPRVCLSPRSPIEVLAASTPAVTAGEETLSEPRRRVYVVPVTPDEGDLMAVGVTVGGEPTLEARNRMRQQDRPLEERFMDDSTDHDAADGQPEDGSGIGWFWEQFGKALSDVEREDVETIAVPTKVVTIATLAGTHTGEWMGHAPAGRRFTGIWNVQVIAFRDGRACENRRILFRRPGVCSAMTPSRSTPGTAWSNTSHLGQFSGSADPCMTTRLPTGPPQMLVRYWN